MFKAMISRCYGGRAADRKSCRIILAGIARPSPAGPEKKLKGENCSFRETLGKMNFFKRNLYFLLGWIAFALFAAPAATFAQTDEIQVYDAAIADKGKFNLMIHSNFTPSGRTTPAFPGGIVPNHSFNGTAEWAYGVTDWFEQGLYLPVYTIYSPGRGGTPALAGRSGARSHPGHARGHALQNLQGRRNPRHQPQDAARQAQKVWSRLTFLAPCAKRNISTLRLLRRLK